MSQAKPYAIVADHLGKRYVLGDVGVGRFLWRNSTPRQDFWALKDVSFSVDAGESLGIIGANGAGKSTLLKILSRVTSPTSGKARVTGRVGTILEVGTGFHPELTGRENIYLSGAILGMRKLEVDARFDEIVDFAGVERFVDTPVKRYSSGMYVRLAFGVAAHLELDIMIIDEVLAVGDIGFQKKCLSKMADGIQKEGRTILFVSHNLQAIRSLCRRALLLDGGRLVADGGVSEVISQYLAVQQTSFDLHNRSIANRLNRTNGRVRFTSISVGNPDKGESWSFRTGDTIALTFGYEVFEPIDSLGFLLTFSSPVNGETITSAKDVLIDRPVAAGRVGQFTISIPCNYFRPGDISVSACLGNRDFSVFEDVIDSNVNLPHLMIESDEEDWHRRAGYFSIDYSIEHK